MINVAQIYLRVKMVKIVASSVHLPIYYSALSEIFHTVYYILWYEYEMFWIQIMVSGCVNIKYTGRLLYFNPLKPSGYYTYHLL
jgi:hypothetical protein